MANQNEYILCSAIWYKELPLIKPEILENFGVRPYNVDKGIVFCGWRHHNCIYQMCAVTGLRDCTNGKDCSGESEQGFLTSKNRFVDRKEALTIALKENQVLNIDDVRSIGLHSEDLYRLREI